MGDFLRRRVLTRPSWAGPDFFWLWTGQSVSMVGERATTLAFPLLALALTESATRAGVVAFAAELPQVLVPLMAGAVVDRIDRRWIMMGCDIGRLVLIGAIPAVGLVAGYNYWQLVATAFAYAGLSTTFLLAEQSAVPYLVEEAETPRAVAANQSRLQGATVIGQPLGGALFGLGAVWPFVLDVASSLFSLVTLTRIRTPHARGHVSVGAIIAQSRE